MVRTGSGARALVTVMGAASLLAVGTAAGQETAPLPRPSVNLYGQPGLIDLPSAEAMPDGEVTGSYSYFGGFQRRNLTFQLLPRVSATVRYAAIANWGEPGDPSEDLRDRSFDLTFQLLRESGWMPGVAVGLRDFLGTGVYSSEFVVATKRVTPDVTVSAGIGWGRLGSSGGVGNPFCDLFSGACDREDDVSDGGDIAFDRFFRGEDAAPFAGVEWRTPVDGLTLKAEYSPDAYEREQESPAAEFERKSRLNFGAEYRVTSGITLGGYWMYGSALGVNLSVTANPFRPLQRQDLAPGPLPVTERPADAPQGRGWATNETSRGRLGAALAAALEAEGVRLEELRVTAETAEVLIVNERLAQDPLAIGRTVRVLQTGLPASVGTFGVTLVRDGLPVTTTVIDRATYEGLIDRPLAGERMWQAAVVESAAPAAPEATGVWRQGDIYPDFGWSIHPVPFIVARGDDDLSVGLNAEATARYQLSPGVSINGRLSQLLLGRSSDPGPSDSALPPVRSDSARYYAGYEPRLARLTGDYVTKLSEDVYARASAGYLERMFAGVSGEVLWKPSASPFGFGVEVNYVAQRDNEGLGFGQYDYEVATGHASVYWDAGFEGFEVQLDAGRYLAGDWGSTLRVTRHFPNGWAFGAYATLTEVATEDFGEGRFDKGVTLEIPLRWATPFETRARTGIALGTGARDGGARLAVENRLYDTVRELDRTRLERNWGAFWQ